MYLYLLQHDNSFFRFINKLSTKTFAMIVQIIFANKCIDYKCTEKIN